MLSCFAPKTKWVRTAPKQLLEGRKQPSEGVVGSIWAPLVADGGCSHLLSYFEFLCKGLKHVIKNTWTILDPTFHRIDAKPTSSAWVKNRVVVFLIKKQHTNSFVDFRYYQESLCGRHFWSVIAVVSNWLNVVFWGLKCLSHQPDRYDKPCSTAWRMVQRASFTGVITLWARTNRSLYDFTATCRQEQRLKYSFQLPCTEQPSWFSRWYEESSLRSGSSER